MKKITKTFVALFVVFVLVATMACAVACENDPCKDGHTASLVRGTAATCTEGGTQDYYKCAVCHKLFSDEACQNEIQAPIPTQKLDHNTGDWLSDDTQHYKFCDRCNTKLEVANHSEPDAEGKCSVCGKVLEEQEPAHVTDKTVAELSATPPTEQSTVIYEVVGVWVPTGNDSDQYGNGLLVDQTTGASLVIYGMAPTVSAFSYAGGVYTFTNPKQFQSLKTSFTAGDKIKLGLAYSTQYKNYYSYFISREDVSANIKYTATVDTGITNGTISLSKSTDLVYGEEVTVTPSPSAGYKVDKIEHNGTAIAAGTDGSYKFKVTAGPNVVSAEFVDEAAVADKLVITAENLLGWSSSSGDIGYQTTDITKELVISGNDKVTLSYLEIACYGDGLQMRYDTKNTPNLHTNIFNTTAFKLEIESITLVATSGKTSKGVLSIAFGTEQLTEAPEEYADTFELADETKTIDCNVAGAHYFRIDHTSSTGAMYIQSITINFKVVAA